MAHSALLLICDDDPASFCRRRGETGWIMLERYCIAESYAVIRANSATYFGGPPDEIDGGGGPTVRSKNNIENC